jgi:iron(III) transport system ATP-binding protein
MNKPVIQCLGLFKSYGDVVAVRNLDLAVDKNEILVLLGPSGCGKTTILRLVAGFESPDAGVVEVEDQVMAGPTLYVPPERRRIGMVFQEYALFPHLNVESNVEFGLSRGSRRKERIQEVLELVGLQGLENRMPHELSGGQQQRVALARALAPCPAILLLDEPFSNLDAGLRIQMREEVRHVLKSSGVSTIFVTHDQQDALFMGDRVAVMNQGAIEQVDFPEAIFHHPTSTFVASFMGVADFLPGYVEKGLLHTEGGSVLAPPGVNDGSKLQLMVRPDDVIAVRSEAGGGNGVVTERTFTGMHYVYQVQLVSGQEVRVLESHFQHYTVGDHVDIHVASGHSLICFTGDGVAMITGESDAVANIHS